MAPKPPALALSSTAWDVGLFPCLFLPDGFVGATGSVPKVSNVPSSSSISLEIATSLLEAFFDRGDTDLEDPFPFGMSGRRARTVLVVDSRSSSALSSDILAAISIKDGCLPFRGGRLACEGGTGRDGRFLRCSSFAISNSAEASSDGRPGRVACVSMLPVLLPRLERFGGGREGFFGSILSVSSSVLSSSLSFSSSFAVSRVLIVSSDAAASATVVDLDLLGRFGRGLPGGL